MAPGAPRFALEGDEVDGGGDEREARHGGRHARLGERRLAAQDIEGRDFTVPVVDAEPGAGIALRVEVDDEQALADGRERRAEIDGGGGLANAALLVGQREDAGAAAQGCAHGALAPAPARGRSPVTSTMWELAEVRLGTSRELNSQ